MLISAVHPWWVHFTSTGFEFPSSLLFFLFLSLFSVISLSCDTTYFLLPLGKISPQTVSVCSFSPSLNSNLPFEKTQKTLCLPLWYCPYLLHAQQKQEFLLLEKTPISYRREKVNSYLERFLFYVWTTELVFTLSKPKILLHHLYHLLQGDDTVLHYDKGLFFWIAKIPFKARK